MKKCYLYIVITLACLTGKGQSHQCVEDIKQERQQKFTALRIGDSMMKIDGLNLKAAVVVFYKTDCPFCEKLMPELKKLHGKYAGRGFEIYAVCLDENATSWEKYITSNGYTRWANYCDGKSYAGTTAAAYHVFAVPSLFLVDENWKIAAKPKGLDDLKKHIELLCTK